MSTSSIEKTLKGRITNSNSLDAFLLELHWLDTLSEKEIETLSKNGFSQKELIIYDYISQLGINRAKQIIEVKGDLPGLLSDIILNNKTDKNTNTIYLKTPIEQLSMVGFSSLVKYKASRNLIPEVNSKEEGKKLLSFDLLYMQLSINRRKLAEKHDGTIQKALEKSAILYTFQSTAKEVFKINTSIEELLKELGKPKSLEINLIENYNKLKNSDPPLSVNHDTDSELADLVKTYENLMGRANMIMREKITAKREELQKSYAQIRDSYICLQEKKILNKADENILRELVLNLEANVDFYEKAKLNDETTFLVTKKILDEASQLQKEYNEFKNTKAPFNKKIKKLSKNRSNEFESCLYLNNFESCKSIVADIRQTHSSCLSYQNRYLESLKEESTSLVNDFYANAGKILNQRVRYYDKQIRGLSSKIQSSRIFGKIFVNPWRKKKINNLITYKHNASILLTQLKK